MRVLVNVLAGYRLLRLIQRDQISLPLRQAYMRFSKYRPFWAYWQPLLTCPFCLSIWIGGAVLLLNAIGGEFWWVIARILAAATIIGFLGYLDHERIR